MKYLSIYRVLVGVKNKFIDKLHNKSLKQYKIKERLLKPIKIIKMQLFQQAIYQDDVRWFSS